MDGCGQYMDDLNTFLDSEDSEDIVEGRRPSMVVMLHVKKLWFYSTEKSLVRQAFGLCLNQWQPVQSISCSKCRWIPWIVTRNSVNTRL